ncbi:DUF2577 domain-containing protein [Paenibacillus sp. FSL R5-0527]|uniref:DUF2577 domain-containing protein n=1 Tax=Paenibacillus TaxID=44249 RepID=UPI00097B732A|nr:DUF2577 domain-containing protein [Paenibacillus macerans]OMG50229.1 hypothetical protein BK140_06730 [Paenibacillus macerans]
MADLLGTLKKAATDAVHAGNPVAVLFGEISKVNPLEVIVDQRFTLTADFLYVTERLTRYEIDLKHNHTFDGGVTRDALPEKIDLQHNHTFDGGMTGDALLDKLDLKHNHAYNGGMTGDALPEKIVIREGLQAGDAVLLLRVQGGQKYVVWDRVVSGS